MDCMRHGDLMDRPAITARVFHVKQQHHLEDIHSKGNCGRPTAMAWTIEYQKRVATYASVGVGGEDEAYLTPDFADECVRAEFPTRYDDPGQSARSVVERKMCQGPYDVRVEAGRSTVKRKGSNEMQCSARFPLRFKRKHSCLTAGGPSIDDVTTESVS